MVKQKIQNIYAALRPSERKVADYIFSYQGKAGELLIEELAREAEVSQPTVVRFVKAVGYKSFKDFKYAMLQDEMRERAEEKEEEIGLYGFRLSGKDRLEEIPGKIITTSIQMLEETLKSIRKKEFERAVDAILGADNIVIYGVENSCTPASDLLTKLTYLGLCCRMHTDAYLQQIAAAHLGVADVAVAFSHSGCSMDTVKALRLARRAGANTIAVTSRKNPLLAKYADVCLYTGGEDTVIYGTAIFSRIPDLAVVDLLYMGIIQSDYERFSRSLDKSGAVIADRGYPEA